MRLEFRAEDGGLEEVGEPAACLVCGCWGRDSTGREHYLNFQRTHEERTESRTPEFIASSTIKSMGPTTASAVAG
jgi:hypothetical protein